ncbi:uncharacterized protein LOC112043892 [Bicyclus anynana]|uniref:Uncharacterized protein LOC112043892 n=1 Tax=Bicyclus anynana TaxID=110368 RepID=A0A6J1MR40_BICAN|nr:uncharacterized protein LOC112043892 [Bicyclus anynana]
MGCFQSKKESSDLHPNVFRVVNIDENGGDLCTGQLEITETDIVLYREGRESTVWPLHSLRRYGFEGEIFSFESGRRCETGEGIYAFRCRRASILFQALQQQIQLRNVVHDSVQYPVSRLSPSPQGRQTLQASVIHRSSIDNGQSDSLGQNFNNNHTNAAMPGIPPTLPTIAQSPRSPSSADILEVMPLYPRPQASSNHVTNVYQIRDFKREHNNNQSEMVADHRHVYSNDFNRDLAILRNTLRQETALNTIRDIEDETNFLENRYVDEKPKSDSDKNLLSPTMSTSSEHYAQLSLEQQEPARLYVNVPPNDNTAHETSKSEPAPTTPLTPKQVEYCNLTVGTKIEINTYANLMLGDIPDSVQNSNQIMNISDRSQKFSESDTFASMSPVEDLNYAILDMDTNKDSIRDVDGVKSDSATQSRGRMVSQSSIDRNAATNTTNPAPSASIGYTTIDFEKTVALTSVAAGAELSHLDGMRNSFSIMCGSPDSADQSRDKN